MLKVKCTYFLVGDQTELQLENNGKKINIQLCHSTNDTSYVGEVDEDDLLDLITNEENKNGKEFHTKGYQKAGAATQRLECTARH